MWVRPLVAAAVALLLVGGAACGPDIDLAKDVAIVDVFTGYYDDGVLREGPNLGWNHLLPSITFRIKNVGAEPFTGLRMLVSFWIVGEDGEKDSLEVRGVSGDALAPGATTDPITVRSTVGYNLQGARSELFTDHRFVDWSAKLVGKRGGKFVRMGEYKLDRTMIPHMEPAGRRP